MPEPDNMPPPSTVVPFNQWLGYEPGGWGYPNLSGGQVVPGTEAWDEPQLMPGGDVFSQLLDVDSWHGYNQINSNTIPGPAQGWNFSALENPLFAGYPRLGWGPQGGALIPEEAANLNYPGNPIDYTDPGNIGGGWGPTPLWMHELAPWNLHPIPAGQLGAGWVMPQTPPGDIPDQFPFPPQQPNLGPVRPMF